MTAATLRPLSTLDAEPAVRRARRHRRLAALAALTVAATAGSTGAAGALSPIAPGPPIVQIDVAPTFAGLSATARAGQIVDFRVVVRNAGPMTSNTTLEVATGSAFSKIALLSGGPCTVSPRQRTVRCTGLAVPGNGSTTVVIRGRAASRPVTATLSATTTNLGDSVPANNTAKVTLTIA